jgi:hypothetical protein
MGIVNPAAREKAHIQDAGMKRSYMLAYSVNSSRSMAGTPRCLFQQGCILIQAVEQQGT